MFFGVVLGALDLGLEHLFIVYNVTLYIITCYLPNFTTKLNCIPMFECYSNIIGFSQADCECSRLNRPEDYDVSKSGLYLDELSPISSVTADENCNKNIWTILESSRASAIKQFVADTNSLLIQKYKQRRKSAMSQVIGEIKKKDTYNPKKNYGVVRMVCSPVRGGIARLKNIGTVFSSLGVIQLEIHDNVDGLLHTLDLNTLSNKHEKNEFNIELPLYSKYIQPLEYYFVFLFNSQNLPKDTSINCGCGNSWVPSFNMDAPYFKSISVRRDAPWSSYVMVGSTEINSLSELQDLPDNMGNNMLGITLELDLTCKVGEVLCNEELDFIGNPLALSMALAIQYMSGVKLADHITKSSILTRDNVVDRDEWEQSALEWQAKYNEHVSYIVSESDYTANDCLTCKDILGLTRQGLFS